MKTTLRILSAIGIFLIIGSIIFLFFIPEPSLDTRFASVTQQTIKDDIDVIASIKSEHRYTLYAQADGVVTGLLQHIGEEVSKFQVLARIKKEQDKQIDSQTETRLQSLVSQHDLAIQQSNKELGRINNAVKAGVLPRFKLNEARSKLQRASAKKIAARDELRSHRNDKHSKRALKNKKAIIRALSRGIITKKSAHDGQWLRKGDPILDIISTDDLIIKAMMSPQQVDKLILGQKVSVSKRDSKLSWTERIVRISPVISLNPNTKNLQEVTISFIKSDDIKSSINEKIKLKITPPTLKSHANSLPIEAVIREGKKFHILYIDKSKKASISDIYIEQGFFSALQQLKCQFNGCNISTYGLSKKQVKVGNSDINLVQIEQELAGDIKIVIPSSGIDDNSLVALEENK